MKDNSIDFFFTYDGKITKFEFWVGLATIVIAYFFTIGMLAIFVEGAGFDIAFIIASVISWFASLALWVKRLRDRGYSAWWLFMAGVPVAGALWLLVQAGFLKGEKVD
jgi:uncharacterized membrane protein YhaH (DUF805 family)